MATNQRGSLNSGDTEISEPLNEADSTLMKSKPEMEEPTVQSNSVSAESRAQKMDDATNTLYESVRESYDHAQPHHEMLHDVIQRAMHQVWERIGTSPPGDPQAGGGTVSRIWNIAENLKQEDRELEFKERCDEVRLEALQALCTSGVNGDANVAPALGEDEAPVLRRRTKDFTLFQEDMSTFQPRERKLLGIPRGVYYESANPLNVMLAFEWKKDVILGPGSVSLSTPSLTALQMWDDICQGNGTFSDQESYLVCEAACYQKDQLCEQISSSLKNKALSAETPNLIQWLRELSLDKRPYLRLHHGDMPVSWPNATGRKIYLKVESGESRAPVTLPLGQHLGSCFTSQNGMTMPLPFSYLNGSDVTKFTFLLETEEGFCLPEDKPHVFTIQTRAPSGAEIADAIGGLSGLNQDFEPYKHLISNIAQAFE